MDSEKATEGSSVIARMQLITLSAFALVVGLIFSTTTPAFANAPVAAAEGCTTPGKGSLLRVRQEFSLGDKAPRRVTPQMKERLSREIEEYEDRTERTFNESGYKNADGTKILLDIDAKSFYDSSNGSGGTPGYNKVMLYGNESHQDRVSGIGVINDPSNTTDAYWRRSTITNPQNTDIALHETGHQLGLKEGYREYITDRSGRRQVDRPDGMEINIDNEVIEPQRWRQWARRNGLDPSSLRSEAENKPGHEGDIMGVLGNRNESFRTRDLRRLLRGAPKCHDEDNELFDKAEQQPDFDTRGPKQGRTCYTHLKPPLKGRHYIATLQGKKLTGLPTGPGRGAPFVAYAAIRYTSGYDRDIQLLRYAHLEPLEASEIKIACSWRKEVAYIKKIMELFSAIEMLHEDNIYLAKTAPCNHDTNQIDNQTFWKIHYRRYMIDMDSYAIHEEVLQRLVTATGAFRLKRYRGRPVRGYPPSDFPRFNRMANDIYEKLLVLLKKSDDATDQQSVALSERARQCYNEGIAY